MNVWLVDFDGKIENLALMRLSGYHKARGDSVTLKLGAPELGLFDEPPDKIYISCIFKWNWRKCMEYAFRQRCVVEVGGTGIDIARQLPVGVQESPPDYALYEKERAIGFISRGCIRRCPFCVVPQKEGKLKRVTTAQEIVGEYNTAIFLDNNFLALPDCQDDLDYLARECIAIDFNQGLDARLVTPQIAASLARCKWLAGPRFALDSTQSIAAVGRAFEILREAGINLSSVFVFCLIGYDGFKSDIERLRLLRRYNVNVYPMGYRDLETGIEPANGWDRRLYKKYRRLIIRLPHAQSVWDDLEAELGLDNGGKK